MRDIVDLPKTAVVLVLQFCCPTSFAAEGTLDSDTAEASAGFYRLSWQASEPVRLVESRSPNFDDSRTVYAGADLARVMSGKPDGDWFYRLESTATGAIVAGPTRLVRRFATSTRRAGQATLWTSQHLEVREGEWH